MAAQEVERPEAELPDAELPDAEVDDVEPLVLALVPLLPEVLAVDPVPVVPALSVRAGAVPVWVGVELVGVVLENVGEVEVAPDPVVPVLVTVPVLSSVVAFEVVALAPVLVPAAAVVPVPVVVAVVRPVVVGAVATPVVAGTVVAVCFRVVVAAAACRSWLRLELAAAAPDSGAIGATELAGA